MSYSNKIDFDKLLASLDQAGCEARDIISPLALQIYRGAVKGGASRDEAVDVVAGVLRGMLPHRDEDKS